MPAGPAAGQAADLDTEPVQPGNAAATQRGDDELDAGGGLTAADGADPDQRFGGELDSRALVGLGAAEVVADGPALQDRDDRQARVKVPQAQDAVDGVPLMVGDGQAGLGGDGRFAHPVLGCGPGQVADLILVAADPGGVLARSGAVVPGPVPGQFGEAPGIQRPCRCGAGEGSVGAQPAIGDEQRHARGAEPAGVMSPDEEHGTVGVRPRARTLRGSGRESQHRAGHAAVVL